MADAAALGVVDGERLEERRGEVLLEPVREVVGDEGLLAVINDVRLASATDDTDNLMPVFVANGGREGPVIVLSDGEGLCAVNRVIVVAEGELALHSTFVVVVVPVMTIGEDCSSQGADGKQEDGELHKLVC